MGVQLKVLVVPNNRVGTKKFSMKYRIYPCIRRSPILEPKNKFFLFLCKNFLEKLLFYLRISFQIRYGFMKKTTASLDVKFTSLLSWHLCMF